MRRYLRNDIGMNLLEASDDRFREILFARREIAQQRPCIDGTALAIRRNRNLLLYCLALRRSDDFAQLLKIGNANRFKCRFQYRYIRDAIANIRFEHLAKQLRHAIG